jgi:uncharacterized protein YgiM (DUF1202 family)
MNAEAITSPQDILQKEETIMSKRNYTNYSKKNENVEPETSEAQVMQFSVPETEPEVKMEPETTTEAVPEIPKIGTVTGCTKLNVRIKPLATATIVSVIDAGTVVEIDEAKSTADWYKVIVPAVNEGYCMRKFIAVQ